MRLGSGNGLVPGHNELTPRPVNGNETYVKGLVIIGLDNGLPPNTWSHNLNKGGFVQPVEFMMFYSRKYHWELSSERSTPCWSRERWVNLIGNISSSERQTLWTQGISTDNQWRRLFHSLLTQSQLQADCLSLRQCKWLCHWLSVSFREWWEFPEENELLLTQNSLQVSFPPIDVQINQPHSTIYAQANNGKIGCMISLVASSEKDAIFPVSVHCRKGLRAIFNQQSSAIKRRYFCQSQ